MSKANGKDHAGSAVVYHDQRLKTERALLASVVFKPSILSALELTPEVFRASDHQKICQAILALRRERNPIDAITVSDRVPELTAYTAGLLDESFIPENAGRYLSNLRKADHERQFFILQEQLPHCTKSDRPPILRKMLELELHSQSDQGDHTIRHYADIPDVWALQAPKHALAIEEPPIEIGTVSNLVAESGIGKSMLSLALCVGVALGHGFLGKRAAQMRVLYLDAENPLGLVQRRLQAIAGGPIPGLKLWGHWNADQPAMLGDSRLLDMAKAEQPLLMVFDSLIRFHDKDENDAKEMREVMRSCRALADAGATVLLIHHCGKNGIYRGSSDIMAGCDQQFVLTSDEDSGELRLTIDKHREQSKRVIRIRADFAAGKFFSVEQHSLPPEEQPENPAELLQRIITDRPGITQNQVIEQPGLRRDKVISLLRSKEGRLWRSQTGPRNARLFYPVEGHSTGSRDQFPTSSHVESSDQFPELVPEDARTSSATDSHCTEPVEASPLVPGSPPPIGGGTSGAGTGRSGSMARTATAMSGGCQ